MINSTPIVATISACLVALLIVGSCNYRPPPPDQATRAVSALPKTDQAPVISSPDQPAVRLRVLSPEDRADTLRQAAATVIWLRDTITPPRRSVSGS